MGDGIGLLQDHPPHSGSVAELAVAAHGMYQEQAGHGERDHVLDLWVSVLLGRVLQHAITGKDSVMVQTQLIT